MAHLHKMDVRGPFIVIAPFENIPNWICEFQKWLPSQPVLIFRGTAEQWEAMLLALPDPKHPDFPILITSHKFAIQCKKEINDVGEYTCMVVDEGQRPEHHLRKLIRSLQRIQASHRCLLSRPCRTSVQKNLKELWGLLSFVNPVIFRKAFFDDLASAIEEDPDIILKLQDNLRPILLCRTKMDVSKHKGQARLKKQLKWHLDFAACGNEGCRHGLVEVELFSHKSMCIKFLKTFTEAMMNSLPVESTMHLTHNLYPEIWTGVDTEGSKAIKLWLLHSGVNFLLNANQHNHGLDKASCMALCILWLENYDPLKGFDKDNIGSSKDLKYLRSMDIRYGCQRSVIKFFKGRVPCSCLDKMRAEAKLIPKTGLCDCCQIRKNGVNSHFALAAKGANIVLRNARPMIGNITKYGVIVIDNLAR